MALNRENFKTRTLTAVLFVLVMLAGLFWNPWSFFVLFSIIHFGCWLEYQELLGKIDPDYAQITPFHKYGVMLAGWSLMLYFTNDNYNIFSFRLHALGWWLGLLFAFVLPLIELLFARQIKLRNIGYSALGLIYISLSCGLMIDISKYIPDKNIYYITHPWFLIPLFIILSIWINDTMAYMVGSLIGKRSLSKISPKKTWEGTLGGIILCVLIVGLAGNKYLDFPTVHAFVIPAIAAITGTAGDLLESKLKRLANVKDSGHIMPGHGGFLDRFDSLLIAAPCVWLYVLMFVK